MTNGRVLSEGGDDRLAVESPDLAARLALFGIDSPSRYIPGFRITYRELDNIAHWMRAEGWSGFIGLDEAVGAYIGQPSDE